MGSTNTGNGNGLHPGGHTLEYNRRQIRYSKDRGMPVLNTGLKLTSHLGAAHMQRHGRVVIASTC